MDSGEIGQPGQPVTEPVEVESFPKPDFPDLMNNMEMSDMADFDLDFEPNKV